MPTVSESAMHSTMISLLEFEGNMELANLVRMSKILYAPQWEFSGIIPYQHKLYVEIKVPVNLKAYAKEKEKILSRCVCEIYEDDDEYYCCDVTLGIRAIVAEEVEYEHKKLLLEKDSFEQKVIKAKCAYIRLDEFTKRAENNPKLFEQYGFENIRLNFSFLDIIRQTRNDTGHPTGKKLNETEFKTMLGNYQLLLDKCLTAISKLPTI